MKKVLSVALLLVLCLSLVACGGNSDAPEGYKLVSNEDVAYRFYAPTNWSINNSGNVNSAYYSSTDPAMVMVTTYMPDADETGLSNFWAIMEESYKTTYKDYTFVSNQVTTLGGRNAEEFVFTATIGTTDYKVKQIITGYGDFYYTLTYMASPETYDSHIEAVTGMAGVFEFK